MVIQNTYPNLSNIVHTDFELGRVIQTVGAADPGITDQLEVAVERSCGVLVDGGHADRIDCV